MQRQLYLNAFLGSSGLFSVLLHNKVSTCLVTCVHFVLRNSLFIHLKNLYYYIQSHIMHVTEHNTSELACVRACACFHVYMCVLFFITAYGRSPPATRGSLTCARQEVDSYAEAHALWLRGEALRGTKSFPACFFFFFFHRPRQEKSNQIL